MHGSKGEVREEFAEALEGLIAQVKTDGRFWRRSLAGAWRMTGHTVAPIEHHPDVIKTADYAIDSGPGGGHAGGEVVVAGTPEEMAACAASHTGRFLRAHPG